MIEANPHSSPARLAVHGYLLAGGQSSRMGTDKALLHLGGHALLDRAVATLASICDDITVVGRGHPTLRHLPDAALSVGPVGGVAAALADLATRQASLALILPVDVPLLPATLLKALVHHWLQNPHLRVAYPIAELQPQPVISLIHGSALAAFDRALQTGQRRLRLVLETAIEPPGSLVRTHLTLAPDTLLADGQPLPWRPSAEEWRTRHLWFKNCNTPADLAELEAALTESY